MQVAIIAIELKNLGYSDTESVPLKVWLQLGFLNRPTDRLIKKIATALSELLNTREV